MRPELETTIDGQIEWAMYEGKMWRIYRPFHHKLFFMLPMVSVENERLLDRERMERILMNGRPLVPSPNEYMDDDQLRDYYLDDSMSGISRYSAEEA